MFIIASLLPDSIILSLSTLPLIVHYRELLCDKLIGIPTESYLASKSSSSSNTNHISNTDRHPITLLGPLSEPALIGFLDLLNNGDFLEAFKALWYKKYEALRNSNKVRNI